MDLLEEYIHFRETNTFKESIDSLSIKEYSVEFIKSYLKDPSNVPQRERKRFEAALMEEHIDLLYLDFLSKYQGKNDVFGVVIDRDCGSHSLEQMNKVRKKCNAKNHLCYITNPCIEFWQLLHVSDVATEYADSLDNILKNKLDNKKNSFVSNLLYEKTGQRKSIQTKTFEKFYLPNIDLAIERAKGFASSDQLLEKLGSNLWELIELLRESNNV